MTRSFVLVADVTLPNVYSVKIKKEIEAKERGGSDKVRYNSSATHLFAGLMKLFKSAS